MKRPILIATALLAVLATVACEEKKELAPVELNDNDIVMEIDRAPPDAVEPDVGQPDVADEPELAEVQDPTPENVETVELIEVETVALTLFDEEAQKVDGDPAELRQFAQLLDDEGKHAEAVEARRKVLFLKPDAKSWAELGRAYLNAGEESRGLACLEEAVALNRFLFDDRVDMAKRYLKRGEIEKARVHAHQVAINRSDDSEANYVAGEAFMKSHMWREAVSSFERVVEVEPENKFARNKLGFAALQIGEDGLALRHLEALIDLEPTPYMMNNLGLAYERMDQEIDAYAAFLTAAEMKPGYVKALVNQKRVSKELDDEERQLAHDIAIELRTARTETAVAQADDETAAAE